MTRDIALLQLMHTRGMGVKTLGRLLRRLAFETCPIGVFVEASADDMIHVFGLSPEIVSGVKEGYDQACELYEDLQKNEIKLLALGETPYPGRLSDILGDAAPPVLCARGNLSLLDMKAVGFCGSRNASSRGCTVAETISQKLAYESVNIVSGYAHGIDHVSHLSALMAGGTTTIVPAIGILHFAMKEELGGYINESNYLVLSEFLPRLGWIARNAMQRNRTICALSDAMVLIESDLKGGTFDAGRAAIELQHPLFVIDYEETAVTPPGNRHFLERGAIRIAVDVNNNVDVTPVLNELEKEDGGISQTSLFD